MGRAVGMVAEPADSPTEQTCSVPLKQLAAVAAAVVAGRVPGRGKRI